MEKRIAVFTIFTLLLFAVSTAQIGLDTFASEISTESVAVADSDFVLSIEKPKSDLNQAISNDQLPESENTQTIDANTIDQTPRLRFARSRPIKRHFFDKTTQIPLRFVRRHPCRKFQKTFNVPQTKTSYGNDMILSSNTYSVDTKTLGDQVPTEWLEFKHNYGHHHHHHDKDEELVPNFMFNRENMVSSSRHHNEKREHKGGFMRRFRKFLKHTFD